MVKLAKILSEIKVISHPTLEMCKKLWDKIYTSKEYDDYPKFSREYFTDLGYGEIWKIFTINPEIISKSELKLVYKLLLKLAKEIGLKNINEIRVERKRKIWDLRKYIPNFDPKKIKVGDKIITRSNYNKGGFDVEEISGTENGFTVHDDGGMGNDYFFVNNSNQEGYFESNLIKINNNNKNKFKDIDEIRVEPKNKGKISLNITDKTYVNVDLSIFDHILNELYDAYVIQDKYYGMDLKYILRQNKNPLLWVNPIDLDYNILFDNIPNLHYFKKIDLNDILHIKDLYDAKDIVQDKVESLSNDVKNDHEFIYKDVMTELNIIRQYFDRFKEIKELLSTSHLYTLYNNEYTNYFVESYNNSLLFTPSVKDNRGNDLVIFTKTGKCLINQENLDKEAR